MDSFTRLSLALNHQEADRVPFDLGGTILTSIHIKSYRRLRSTLGLPEVEPRLMNVDEQIADVDEDVRSRLAVDVRNVAPRATEAVTVFREMPGYTYFYDEWGIGWKMPRDGGLYFDMFDHPLKNAQSVADIEKYPWPNPANPARYVGMRKRARKAKEEEKQGVFLDGLSAGMMEIASWMRGYENFYTDCIDNQKLLVAIMTKVMELKMAYWEVALGEAGENISALEESDDLGAQTRLMISPALYRKLLKPLQKQLLDFIHARTKAKIFYHSCGAIRAIIPDLIEVGIDALNPVQVSAPGMDSAELKREYGKDLAFWGGGVDTQGVLGSGTPQQVRDDVRRRIEDFAPGGGFVFAAVHNIQSDVSPENVLAMWETLQEYGKYE